MIIFMYIKREGSLVKIKKEWTDKSDLSDIIL